MRTAPAAENPRQDTAQAACTKIVSLPNYVGEISFRANGKTPHSDACAHASSIRDTLTAADRARIVDHWQSAAGWVRDMQTRLRRLELVTRNPRAVQAEIEREAHAADGGAAA